MHKKYDVVVVGELNVDIILNRIESFPEIGKEKIADSMTVTLGSSSAIFASNLSSLGARVAFIGKIGDDSFADLIIRSLESKRVDTSMIVRDASLITGATIVLNFNQDRAMVTHPGAMNHLTLEDISPNQIKQAQHLHFSSCFLQPGIKPDLTGLFKMAKELGLTTSFDAQWDPAEKWDIDIQSILPYVDVFLPNRVEALHLTQEQDLTNALAKLAETGDTVVIKLGEQGSLSQNGKTTIKLPAFLNRNVVDAIGAGDSFNAGFIFKYIQGMDLRTCQTFGNLTGAINTTQAGGTTAFAEPETIYRIAEEKFGYTEQ